MNSSQRRKFIRSTGADHNKKFDFLMASCQRYLMQLCIPCSAAIHLPTLLENDTTYACPQEHWKQWLTTVGDKSLAVLLNSPEGTVEWLVKDIKEEAERRAEGILVNTIGENNE